MCYNNYVNKNQGFNMIKPDLIIRSYRRSLSLTVTNEGKFVVHAPKKLSIDEIFKFIKEKEQWINNKINAVQNKLKINKNILEYKDYLFLGKKYQIEFINGIKQIELSDKKIILPIKYQKLDINKKIKKWYIDNASKILSERFEYFASLMQLDYLSLSIMNSKNRWGSCDSNRNIKLNFRLLMLPHKAIDYVIIHELAHIVEFNHSKNFYNIISAIMPSYKVQQKTLKEYEYILKLFR